MWGPSAASQPPQSYSYSSHYPRMLQPTPTYVMVQPQMVSASAIVHSPYVLPPVSRTVQWWGEQHGEPSTSNYQFPLLSPQERCVYHSSPMFRKRKWLWKFRWALFGKMTRQKRLALCSWCLMFGANQLIRRLLFSLFCLVGFGLTAYYLGKTPTE